ncbi:peptidoglycan editing factor PgeF [Rhodoferax mekongensis]|uniref:Purine nucleoside phosphorylase n=1 Tax=Rhodoferax mekongensis TaxID=3068341 RepID=A0ABZ0AWY6_9BURK|nr:peptidoglycan editing factor PgeF [Rhodoferax sp. TBRC 17307]WNO03815.1 peptidoglycan editing factor PgeF [Rhodoferax sp. TBRC 17307]
MATTHADWIIPDWPAPLRVRALCTTRQGGVSSAPYDSLNLGLHVADDAAAVGVNRQRLAQAVGGRPVFLNQVHGNSCVHLEASTPDGTEADACYATQPGTVCTIMVADCLPVLFAAADGSWVAAAHAGWRGLAGVGGQGVLEETLKCFSAPAPVDSAQVAPEIIAWLGPCIGPQAFEVGDDVRGAFVEALPAATACFTPLSSGKWLADLPALARQRLQLAGVNSIWGNDGSTAWCTVSNPSRFFSHRRDRVSGRLAACIWLE